MGLGENSWRSRHLFRTVLLPGVFACAACSSTTQVPVELEPESQIADGTYVLRRYNGDTLPARVRGRRLFPNMRRDSVVADTLFVTTGSFLHRVTLIHPDSVAPYSRAIKGHFAAAFRTSIYIYAAGVLGIAEVTIVGTVRNSAPGWVSWAGFGAWELPEMDVFDFERIAP